MEFKDEPKANGPVSRFTDKRYETLPKRYISGMIVCEFYLVLQIATLQVRYMMCEMALSKPSKPPSGIGLLEVNV